MKTKIWPTIGFLILALLSFSCGAAMAHLTAPGSVETTPVTEEAPAEETAPETEAVPETTAYIPPTEETTPETEPATEATEPPTEPETIPTEPAYPYTEKELEYLALVIYQEAGGDMYSDKTRLMVGTVVMNRLEHKNFPDTIFDVILQRGQYGRLYWTGPTWPSRRWDPLEAHAVERAYDIAERIMNGERALPKDVVYQSEYIQGEIVAHQGGFYFCR